MAITETIRDVENYPTKTKTVTLDLQKIVPIDNEGDEVYVVSAAPGTGSTNKVGGGAINPIFMREFKAGFARSSGFVNPPFTITSSNKNIRVSIDGSTYREIALEEGTGLTGDDIAADMQAKINALASVGGLEAGKVEFLSATVEFKNNKFAIVSGSISNTYTGVGKSSVKLLPGATNDISSTIGFNIYFNSEDLSGIQVSQTVLTSGYTSGTTLNVSSSTGLVAGNAFMLTDGTNKEYFVASGISTAVIEISGTGLANAYASGSLVQKIFERDPDSELASPYEDMDSLTRFALRSIANQTDFSV